MPRPETLPYIQRAAPFFYLLRVEGETLGGMATTVRHLRRKPPLAGLLSAKTALIRSTTWTRRTGRPLVRAWTSR